MIAAKYTQGGTLEIGEAPTPEIGDDELLLRVEATSICGTDVRIVRHGHHKLRDGQTIILGHEFVGTIAKAGPGAGSCAVGTRVGVAPNIGCGTCEMCACGLGNMCPRYSAFGIDRDGAHAEYVRIPQAAIAQGNVVALPAGLSAVEGCLAEPLSCVVNSTRTSRIEPGDIVVVYGAGPMGLLHLMVASQRGAARVVVVDPAESRLEKATALGASAVLNPRDRCVPEWVASQTDGRGVDAVIAACPVPSVAEEGLRLLAPFGRLCLFAGLPKGDEGVQFDSNMIHYKNLVVTGVTGGSPRDYRTALKLIECKKVDVGEIVSHVMTIRDLREAYDTALSSTGMRVVLAAEA
jgi:L-iditol 2-dehydrogenase